MAIARVGTRQIGLGLLAGLTLAFATAGHAVAAAFTVTDLGTPGRTSKTINAAQTGFSTTASTPCSS